MICAVHNLLLAAAAFACAACGPGGPGLGADAGMDAKPATGQGSEARGPLVINEVYPRGAGPDWIELLNRSDAPIDLCGYFVTDALDRLDHYLPLGAAPPPEPCEPRLLGPGDYLVIYADDETASGSDHAPFKLGVADEAHLVTADGVVADSFVFLHPASGLGLSFSRAPNGAGLFYLAEPTAGRANVEGAP